MISIINVFQLYIKFEVHVLKLQVTLSKWLYGFLTLPSYGDSRKAKADWVAKVMDYMTSPWMDFFLFDSFTEDFSHRESWAFGKNLYEC
jgi:hypothetical protein